MNITAAIEKVAPTAAVLQKYLATTILEQGAEAAIENFLASFAQSGPETPAGIVGRAALEGDREAYKCLVGRYPSSQFIVIEDI